jgi:hypothetical protein
MSALKRRPTKLCIRRLQDSEFKIADAVDEDCHRGKLGLKAHELKREALEFKV